MFDQFATEAGIFPGEEGIGSALLSRPSRPPNPMGMGIDISSHIKVDHSPYLLDIQTSGCHIGRYQHPEFLLLEGC